MIIIEILVGIGMVCVVGIAIGLGYEIGKFLKKKDM
jgi:hypothetical protein